MTEKAAAAFAFFDLQTPLAKFFSPSEEEEAHEEVVVRRPPSSDDGHLKRRAHTCEHTVGRLRAIVRALWEKARADRVEVDGPRPVLPIQNRTLFEDAEVRNAPAVV
ncbi:hypothetical protein MTO96_042527 [Rhipicephalus appendiculatus]